MNKENEHSVGREPMGGTQPRAQRARRADREQR